MACFDKAETRGLDGSDDEHKLRFDYQKNALDVNKKFRELLNELQAEDPNNMEQNSGLKHLDFVEGGLVDIVKREYRQSKKDVVNRFAKKYFHFYKGLVLLDMECKVRHHLLQQLAHLNGGDDKLHDEMKAVAAKMLKKPENEDDLKLDEPGDEPEDQPEPVAPIETLKQGIDGKKWKSEIKSIRMKITKVEDVLVQLHSVMGKASKRPGRPSPRL
jgi:hypothetical protein